MTLLQPPLTFQLEDDTPQNLLASFRKSSGWSSDDEYDSDTSDNAYEIDLNSSAEAKLNHFHRIFSRQPGPGGIILPLVHNSMQDLIQIGWTKARPLMVETCTRQILEGLSWIHDEAGLIHRDISAGNILVTIAPGGYRDEQMGLVQDRKDGKGRGIVQCLISDFGCATFNSASDTTTDAVQNNDGATTDEHSQHNYYQPQQRQQKGLTFEVGTRYTQLLTNYIQAKFIRMQFSALTHVLIFALIGRIEHLSCCFHRASIPTRLTFGPQEYCLQRCTWENTSLRQTRTSAKCALLSRCLVHPQKRIGL